MAGRTGQRANAGGTGVFDVRVLAFAGKRAPTLHALQELFGLDLATAERIVASTPMLIKRGATQAEAQQYVVALQGIGAQVVIENQVPGRAAGGRQGLPPLPPLRARGAPPPPPPEALGIGEELSLDDDEPLPKPKLRPPSADLEFDMADESAALRALDTAPADLTGELVLDEPEHKRRATRGEIELEASAALSVPDLDPVARADATGRLRPVANDNLDGPNLGGDKRADATRTGGQRPLRTNGAQGAPLSRAAVVERAGLDANRHGRRSVPLLQLLAAVAIGAGGVMLDNTVLFGNATPLSVALHGLAIGQLGLGIRGLFK